MREHVKSLDGEIHVTTVPRVARASRSTCHWWSSGRETATSTRCDGLVRANPQWLQSRVDVVGAHVDQLEQRTPGTARTDHPLQRLRAGALRARRDIYMVNKSELVVPVPQLVTSPPSLFDVLYYIPVGPTTDEQLRGITSQVPHTLVVNQATILNGVALVTSRINSRNYHPWRVASRWRSFLSTPPWQWARHKDQVSINQTPFSLTLANGTSVRR